MRIRSHVEKMIVWSDGRTHSELSAFNHRHSAAIETDLWSNSCALTHKMYIKRHEPRIESSNMFLTRDSSTFTFIMHMHMGGRACKARRIISFCSWNKCSDRCLDSQRFRLWFAATMCKHPNRSSTFFFSRSSTRRIDFHHRYPVSAWVEENRCSIQTVEVDRHFTCATNTSIYVKWWYSFINCVPNENLRHKR